MKMLSLCQIRAISTFVAVYPRAYSIMSDASPILVVPVSVGVEPFAAPLAMTQTATQTWPGLIQLNGVLRESEERYRMLFEAMDEGFCIIEQMQATPGGGSDFRYIEANPAFKRHTGLSDPVGKTLRQVIPGECEEWIATYDRVVETGEAIRFERGLIGQGRVLELYAFSVGERSHLRVGVNFRDITERRQSEDLLRRNRDTFFNLVENAPFGLYVVDAQFCLRQVSAAAQKAFSHVAPLIGRDFDEVLRCLWTDPFASEALAHFRHTLATGEPYAAPNTTQTRHDIPDVESYDWKIERITLPDGQFGVACYFYDITERMQAQEALRKSEERFRALFDRGPVAIYSVDASGVIQEFNAVAARLWGREPKRGDIDDRFCGSQRLYSPDGIPLPYALTPVAKVLDGQLPEARDVEVLVERPDGSRITVVANVVPLRNGQGDITGAINCFYDITERKRLERETQQQAAALEEQARRKNEFLAMLGHELRNPLAPIMSAVHLLVLQSDDQTPQHRKALQIIERQARQLKLLVDDLLEVSRISSGRITLQCLPITVRGVIERAVETVEPTTSQRLQKVIVSLPAQDVWLQADAARLEQVVVNLLTNASKYSDAGARIWVTAWIEGDTLVLSVRDTGIGIAPDVLPHVFDLFTQADRSLDRAQGGLGIGLCLVQRLVELHGGIVQARSVLHEGSEFIVKLPIMASARTVPLPPSVHQVTLPTSISLRVLVVDDNADAADTLSEWLESFGHAVQVANDGHRALEAVSSFRPDIVLLDIGLPGLDGLEVARRLRARPAFDQMLLVAMTGYGHQSDREQTRAAGFDHHLVKPADFVTLQGILNSRRP